MATQYTDGTFSETLPLPEALEVFADALESGTAKSFHVGTANEIEDVKSNLEVSERLEQLKSRLDDLESNIKPSVIVKPTIEQIEKFT